MSWCLWFEGDKAGIREVAVESCPFIDFFGLAAQSNSFSQMYRYVQGSKSGV